MTSTQDKRLARPYRVAVLGGGHRYFSNRQGAIEFARTQAVQSWNDETWTVWDRRTNEFHCTVDRLGHATYGPKVQAEIAAAAVVRQVVRPVNVSDPAKVIYDLAVGEFRQAARWGQSEAQRRQDYHTRAWAYANAVAAITGEETNDVFFRAREEGTK